MYLLEVVVIFDIIFVVVFLKNILNGVLYFNIFLGVEFKDSVVLDRNLI